MMYLVSTDYEAFVFETHEALMDFLTECELPTYSVKQVEPSPLYEMMASETAWKLQ